MRKDTSIFRTLHLCCPMHVLGCYYRNVSHTCFPVHCLLQVDTENSTKVSFSPSKSYSVKLMESSRKSDYSVRKLRSSDIFYTIEELLDEITASLNVNPKHIGYIEPDTA